MPKLRELAIARAYSVFPVEELRHPYARVKIPPPSPWPPRELLVRPLEIDGCSTDLAELVEVLEEQYDDLPVPHRTTWDRFFNVVESLTAEQAFNAADLAAALAALSLPVRLGVLRDHLQARIATLRQNFFVTMSWDG